MLFDVKLAVEVNESLIKATLYFMNNTSDKLYLDGMTLCWNNKIERNVFTIVSHEGEKACYTGMMLKRILVPQDFLLLKIGEHFKSTVILNEAYEFKKENRYNVQYSAFNPGSYDPKDRTIIKMESNKVEIAY